MWIELSRMGLLAYSMVVLKNVAERRSTDAVDL
jgi:hypothetical protein